MVTSKSHPGSAAHVVWTLSLPPMTTLGCVRHRGAVFKFSTDETASVCAWTPLDAVGERVKTGS